MQFVFLSILILLSTSFFVICRTSKYFFFKFWISIEFLSIIYKIFICYRLFLPYEVATLVYIDSLISTISASINFVIFYFFNESFRKELMKFVGKPSLISSQVSYSGYQRQSQGLAENTKSIYTVLWLQRWETLSSYTSPCQSQNHSVGCQCVCLVHGLQTWSNNTWEKPTCFKSDLCILSFNCFLWFIGSEKFIIWQKIYSSVPNKQISLLCTYLDNFLVSNLILWFFSYTIGALC